MNKNQDKIEHEFNQKKINHIFHYTNSFEVLLKIIKNGFAPSYCYEKLNETEYYIPMVSFCNIPLKDVDIYMLYGKYGIGMSLEWAIHNNISPVVYIHENTPFRDIHRQINLIHLAEFSNKVLTEKIKEITDNIQDENTYLEEREKLSKISNITVPILQFLKNWKTKFKNKEIITYNEREWRFIPDLINHKRLITDFDDEFHQYKEKSITKPHLPQYSLQIKSISDLKYLVIKNEHQREKIIELLQKKFGSKEVTDAILSGKFLILTKEQIHHDF